VPEDGSVVFIQVRMHTHYKGIRQRRERWWVPFSLGDLVGMVYELDKGDDPLD
jgi:hypothetical protein